MSNLKVNFIYSSILTTANYLFPFILFPYVSRVLGVTNVGLVNFVDSVINYFVLFSMMGISIMGIREIASVKNDQECLNKTFSSLFVLNAIATVVALIVLLISSFLVPQFRCHMDMMMVGALKLISNFMLIEWFYKGLEEFKFITIRTIVVKILYLLSVLIFVREETDFFSYYILTVLMILVNALINTTYSRHFAKLSFKEVHIDNYLKAFFVLGTYILLTSVYLTFNITYLGFVSGDTEVGYYVTASKIHKMLIALFTAFTGVMLPRLSSLLSDGKLNEFKDLLYKSNEILFVFSIPLIVFSTIYAPTIVRFIAGEGYEGAVLPMRIIMPLLLVIGYEQVLIIEALTPLHKDRALFVNSVFGACIALFLNVLLVPYYASVGSSLVWVAAECTVMISAQYFVKKYIQISFPYRLLVKYLLINAPLLLILLTIYIYVDNIYYSFLLSIIILLMYMVLTQVILPINEIKRTWNQITNKLIR